MSKGCILKHGDCELSTGNAKIMVWHRQRAFAKDLRANIVHRINEYHEDIKALTEVINGPCLPEVRRANQALIKGFTEQIELLNNHLKKLEVTES
jgi:hypothetical protein